MDRKPWSDEEVELLRSGSTSLSSVQLAEQLGRPLKMVRWKAGKLGIKLIDARRDNRGAEPTVWTEDRLAYLREHGPVEPAADIAAALGLTEGQVRQAKSHYGIEGRGVARKQDPEHVERRVAPLRGVQKVDREIERPCRDCGRECPPFAYPSERERSTTWLCSFCRNIRRHGIQGAQALQMIADQGNRCMTCKRSFDEHRPVLDHDHDHCPGTFGCSVCARGFVCYRCNHVAAALDLLHHNPELAEAFEIYLGR